MSDFRSIGRRRTGQDGTGRNRRARFLHRLALLLYHLRLRCFVVVELKNEEFGPEFVGKTNVYLAAVDDQMRHPEDRPSIGLILCKEHNRVIVEYALKDTTRPIGVARWESTSSLPEDLRGALPSPEQLAIGHGTDGGAGAS